MLSERNFQYTVELLTTGDASSIVYRLSEHFEYPSGDSRLLPYLETLLNDRRVYLMGPPFDRQNHGILAYDAADALASERSKLGIMDDVVVKSIFRCLGYKEIEQLRIEAGIQYENYRRDEPTRILQLLVDKGLVPTKDMIFSPKERLWYFEKRFNRWVEWLTTGGRWDVTFVLQEIWRADDERLLPYVEALLDDKRITFLNRDIKYSHHVMTIAHIAAQTLQRMRARLGIADIVIAKQIIDPLPLEDAEKLCEQENLVFQRGGLDRNIESFTTLIDRGLITHVDLELNPKASPSWRGS
jgi:hypothetical protein